MSESITPEEYKKAVKKTRRVRRTKGWSELEQAFMAYWRDLTKGTGYPKPERQVIFHPERKWKFDFAWPKELVAVEVEGGVWVEGRHTRGSGFVRDVEKYNNASFAGWVVLRYTEVDIRTRPIQMIEEITGMLERRAALFAMARAACDTIGADEEDAELDDIAQLALHMLPKG